MRSRRINLRDRSWQDDQPSNVVNNRTEVAKMAIIPSAATVLCHHRLRRSPMSERRLLMMTSKALNNGETKTVRD